MTDLYRRIVQGFKEIGELKNSKELVTLADNLLNADEELKESNKKYTWKKCGDDWCLMKKGVIPNEDGSNAIITLSRLNRNFPLTVYVGDKEDKELSAKLPSDNLKEIKEYILNNIDEFVKESLKESRKTIVLEKNSRLSENDVNNIVNMLKDGSLNAKNVFKNVDLINFYTTKQKNAVYKGLISVLENCPFIDENSDIIDLPIKVRFIDNSFEDGYEITYQSGETEVYLEDELEESLDESKLAIKYWVDEDHRDQGISDIYFGEFKDLADAKRIADKLFDEYASVEVVKNLDSEDEEVVYGRYPEEESLKESINDYSNEDIDVLDIHVSNIDWETDLEDVDLPTEVDIEIEHIKDEDEDLDRDFLIDEIANELSDRYGWLVNTFNFEVKEEIEESVVNELVERKPLEQPKQRRMSDGPLKEETEKEFKDKMNFLKKDEEEAISGYDKVIPTVDNETVKKQLKKINKEEKAHKAYLTKVQKNKSTIYTEPLDDSEDR